MEEHIITKPTKASDFFSGASPKLTFFMGIAVGVALVSIVGFIALASYAAGGSGNWLAKAPSLNNPTPNAEVGDQPNQPAQVNIAVKDTDYIRGEKNAPVTIISYSDLECPFCKRFHPEALKILQEFPGKVRLVYRHFPLSFHQNAAKQAEAAECVGKLGGADKYWSFIDKIFARTTSNGTGFALDKLPALAAEVGVSQSKFKSCLDNGEMASKVQADVQEGTGFGVGGTPTSFVNGKTVEGAVPFEQLKAMVQQALSQ